jgi:hypothetical protein
MAALDLTAVTQLPYVAWTATPGTANLCRVVLLPSFPVKMTIHNRDKASKDLVMSTDQTLTDGGAAPANTYFTVDGQTLILHGENRITGKQGVTQLTFFSPSHTAVNLEILLEEGEL